MSYDIEDFLAELEDLLAAKINAKVTAIEAEKTAKGVPVGLPTFSTADCFFLQSWDDKILNLSPAIFYGIENVVTSSAFSGTQQEYKVFIEVIYLDNKMDALGVKRLLRYTKALREVIEENFKDNDLGVPLKVENLRPIAFALNNSSPTAILYLKAGLTS